jgi:hypothetical protein
MIAWGQQYIDSGLAAAVAVGGLAMVLAGVALGTGTVPR